MKKLWLVLACIAFLPFASNETQAEGTYSADKVWTVTFTSELNPNSITNETIYIKDATGKKLDNVKFTFDDTKMRLYIDALNDYKPGQYTLHITDKVKSKQGKQLKATTTKSFTIAESGPLTVMSQSQLSAQEKQLVENWEQYFNEVVGAETDTTGGEAVYKLDQNLYLVTTGFKPTGGYGIHLQKSEATATQATLYFESSKPAPGQVVTEAITNPYLIIKNNSPTITEPKFVLDGKPLLMKSVPIFNPRLTMLDLRDEYVIVSNNSSSDVDLSGWTLVSTVGDQHFTFPAGYTLKSWNSVFILSGVNNRYMTNTHLYWTDSNMWNNTGDTAQLYTADGVLVNEISLP